VTPVGLIPAAGHATRLGLGGGSKEALEVRGRPLLVYLLERMRRAGCAEIRVVTRPEKRDVAELARAGGAEVVLGRPASVAASLLLAVDGLEPDRRVVLGFPDTIWEPADGFVLLLERLGPDVDVVLGLFRTPDLTRSDVVALGDEGLVTAVQIKPEHPASDLIWGCAATTAAVLGRLRDVHEPGELFDRLARTGRVAGVHLSDEWLDVGTPDALERARG
jgi:NDP-sugar pyrophosphorylase family protein